MKKPKPNIVFLLTLTCLFIASMLMPGIQTKTFAANANNALRKASNAGKKTRDFARKNAKPDGTTDGPIANIDENWFLEITPGYMSLGGASIDKLYGASASLGYRLTQEEKFQIEIGVYRSSSYSSPISYARNMTYDAWMTAYDSTGLPLPSTPQQPNPALKTNIPYTMNFGIDANKKLTGLRSTGSVTAIPVLLSYSYCIQFGPGERFELRMTPTIGMFGMMNSSWRVNAQGSYTEPKADGISYVIDSAYSNDGVTINKTESLGGAAKTVCVFTLGGGIGLSYAFTQRLYVDIAYRYLWTAKTSNATDPVLGWNAISVWNGFNAHNYTATLGWKF